MTKKLKKFIRDCRGHFHDRSPRQERHNPPKYENVNAAGAQVRTSSENYSTPLQGRAKGPSAPGLLAHSCCREKRGKPVFSEKQRESPDGLPGTRGGFLGVGGLVALRGSFRCCFSGINFRHRVVGQVTEGTSKRAIGRGKHLPCLHIC